MTDFFVSYNKADAAWAVWLSWQLESAGYSVVVQAWAFLPGQSFVRRMDQAMQDSIAAYETKAHAARPWG